MPRHQLGKELGVGLGAAQLVEERPERPVERLHRRHVRRHQLGDAPAIERRRRRRRTVGDDLQAMHQLGGGEATRRLHEGRRLHVVGGVFAVALLRHVDGAHLGGGAGRLHHQRRIGRPSTPHVDHAVGHERRTEVQGRMPGDAGVDPHGLIVGRVAGVLRRAACRQPAHRRRHRRLADARAQKAHRLAVGHRALVKVEPARLAHVAQGPGVEERSGFGTEGDEEMEHGAKSRA